MLLNNIVIVVAVGLQSLAVHPLMFIVGRFVSGVNSGNLILRGILVYSKNYLSLKNWHTSTLREVQVHMHIHTVPYLLLRYNTVLLLCIYMYTRDQVLTQRCCHFT